MTDDRHRRRPRLLLLLVALTLGLTGCSAAGATPPVARSTVGGAGSTPGSHVPRCPMAPRSASSTGADGASTRLMPFEPAVIVVCRYGGLNSGHSQDLVATARPTSRRTIDALRAVVNASGATRWVGGYSCPADFATITMIIAADASAEVTLRASRTGCPTISNGSVTNARIQPPLARRLAALVGPAGS